MVQWESAQQAKRHDAKNETGNCNRKLFCSWLLIPEAKRQPNKRHTNKPKDSYKPEEDKRRDGPLLSLIQGGFAELNAVARYQGNDKPPKGSGFSSVHSMYVLVR